MNMKSHDITLHRIIILSAKTAMSYCVFLIFLFTVPVYDAIQEVGGISQIFKDKTHIVLGDSALIVEIADTSAERARGLSSRDSIPNGWGMFFIFDKPGLHSIWMKEMNFPIDIIWLSDKKQVISIKENVSPNSYPTTFEPAREALYVLEVKSGFVQENGIKLGDQLTTF